MSLIFDKILRKILKFAPFKIKYYFDKNYFIFIDEVEILYHQLKNNKGPKFTMLDVGAHWGTTCLPFADINWEVHAFEPDPTNREKLLINKRGNIKVDKRAVSDQDNLELPFYKSTISTGISSLTKFHESHNEAFKVKTVTLKTYCQDNKIEKIDFMKIDTEGFDLFVLKGYDWLNKPKPSTIICEFDEQKTQMNGYTYKELLYFLDEKGYSILVSSWKKLEIYGKGHQWDSFLTFSEALNYSKMEWGNIIAVKKEYAYMLKAF